MFGGVKRGNRYIYIFNIILKLSPQRNKKALLLSVARKQLVKKITQIFYSNKILESSRLNLDVLTLVKIDLILPLKESRPKKKQQT